MAREAPTTVYTEVQIDEDSLSLTLISEGGSNGPIVEDTERFTFDELQSLSGEHNTLRLSDKTSEAWSEQKRFAQVGRIYDGQESDNLPEVGDAVIDQNPPEWSTDLDGLVVTEVLEDVRADEYVIQGRHSNEVIPRMDQHWTDKTVAEANPSCDNSESVIIAQYENSSGEYAFPESRLSDE